MGRTASVRVDHRTSPRGPREVASSTRVLCIVGDSRCGSTLMQQLLALQPGVAAVGEVARLHELAAGEVACRCGSLVNQCPFWLRVIDRMGLSFDQCVTRVRRTDWQNRVRGAIERTAAAFGARDWASGLIRDEGGAARNCVELLRHVSHLTQRRVIVDSSKSPSHFFHLYSAAPEMVTPIFMIRDARGIVWSKMKRSKIDVNEAVGRWRRTAKSLLAVRKLVPASLRALVRYEDLCRTPLPVLTRSLSPLDIAVESVDLAGAASADHALGGSPRFRQSERGTIELDESWRREMPRDVLRMVESLTGAINHEMGYD